MSPDRNLIALSVACAGLGLFAVGALQLLVLRRGAAARALVLLLGCGLGLALAAVLDQQKLVAETGMILAAVLVPVVLLQTRRIARIGAVLARTIRNPALCASALSLLGLGAALGTTYVRERAAADETLATDPELDPNLEPARRVSRARAITDRGTPVALLEPLAPRSPDELARLETAYLRRTGLDKQALRRKPADDRTNCHGWVFTGGDFSVSGASVPAILAENNYAAVSDPAPGDLVVYRNGESVTHTAVVRDATPGQSVLVEGKWGCMGVFLHPVEKSCYGSTYAFHRSPRRGHLLNSVGGTESSSVRGSTVTRAGN